MGTWNEVGPGAALRHKGFSAARLFAGLLLAVVALQSAAPPNASAGTYTVFPCNGKGDDLDFSTNDLAFDVTQSCSQALAGVNIESDPNFSGSESGRGEWSLSTPGDTSLLEVSMNLDFSGAWSTTPLTWEAEGGNDILERAGRGGTRSPSDGPVGFTAGPTPGPGKFRTGSNRFAIRIACRQANCPRGPSAGVLSKNIRVVLEDSKSPTIAKLQGTLLQPGAQQGTRFLSFEENDPGSGLFSSELLIDGNVVAVIRRTNGGRCTEPFEFLAPCLRAANTEHRIDTASIADGSHVVALRVCDAAANCTREDVVSIFVRNAPTNTAPPLLFGSAKVGSTLESQTGTWQGAQLKFSRQWLRCPAAVTSAAEAAKCSSIAGAVTADYVPLKADAGQRAMLEVTATVNAAGQASASAFSAPSDVIVDLPAPPPAPRPEPPPVSGPPPSPGPPPVAQSNPPQTQLKKRPRKKTALTTTRFSFVSDQPDARFECKLDKRGFRPCASPFKKKLKRGAHVFRVRAVNGAGQVDGTPAVFRWKIKPPPPR
jgi:hypothetical protein